MATMVVRESGTIEFIWDDAVAFIAEHGECKIERASHVEPVGSEWVADLGPVGGPVLPACKTRAEALRNEVDWLVTNKLL